MQRAQALADCIDPRLFFARRTAAAIWELPTGPRPPGNPDDLDELDVATFSPRRAPRRSGLRSCQVLPRLATVVAHNGIRVTDPASTWAMLAGGLSRRDGVALGDAIIHKQRIPGTDRLSRPPTATLADLHRAVSAGRRPGIRRLRELLPLLSSQSASPPESHLRLQIIDWGLPAPALDVDVYTAHGRLAGCSELAYPEHRLALEYEGRHHLQDPAQWNRDIVKYRDYAAAGWEVLRVTSELLYRSPQDLRNQLLEALTLRSWRGLR